MDSSRRSWPEDDAARERAPGLPPARPAGERPLSPPGTAAGAGALAVGLMSRVAVDSIVAGAGGARAARRAVVGPVRLAMGCGTGESKSSEEKESMSKPLMAGAASAPRVWSLDAVRGALWLWLGDSSGGAFARGGGDTAEDPPGAATWPMPLATWPMPLCEPKALLPSGEARSGGSVAFGETSPNKFMEGAARPPPPRRPCTGFATGAGAAGGEDSAGRAAGSYPTEGAEPAATLAAGTTTSSQEPLVL